MDGKNEELKPCPFCGGEAETKPYGCRHRYWVARCCDENCIGCLNLFVYQCFETEEQAIQAWNTRQTFKPVVDVEEIEKIILDWAEPKPNNPLAHFQRLQQASGLSKVIASHINEGRGGE